MQRTPILLDLADRGGGAPAEPASDSRRATTARTGFVSLVGAGPGAADLVTVRAQQRLAAADVVIHDRLVGAGVLALARADAQRIPVGKARGGHGCAQDQINRLIVAHARLGRRVVRLKGGDPFVFGRGGEEAEALAEAGIPFEVVPGITAATGCAAAAGIPLTHRDHAHVCVLVTGHTRDGRLELDWPALARPGQTLAVYMGLANLALLCRQLIAHGLDADTPAAAVENGTTERECVIVATLATLPDQVAGRIAGPTLILVGSVVRLHARLTWFMADPPQAGYEAP